MSDQPEALRLADDMSLSYHSQTQKNEIAAELRRLHAENEQLKAERDALKAEVERLKGVSYDLAGQLMVLRATKQMTATIDAAKGET